MSTFKSNVVHGENTKFSKLTRVKDDGTEIELDSAQYDVLFTVPSTVTGSQTYSSPGTYQWVAPAGVYKVSVCCIGGGGAGQDGWANPAGGGAGLAWKNQYL